MGDVMIVTEPYMGSLFSGHAESVSVLAANVSSLGHSVTIGNEPPEGKSEKVSGAGQEVRDREARPANVKGPDLNAIAESIKRQQKNPSDGGRRLYVDESGNITFADETSGPGSGGSHRISQVTEDRFYGPVTEAILIFIGSSVGGTALNKITDDAYQAAKDWARKRFKDKKKPGGVKQDEFELPIGVEFTIYDSEGKALVSFKIDEGGEREERKGHS